MNLAIDVRLAQLDPYSKRGYGSYVQNLARSIIAQHDGACFVVGYNDPRRTYTRAANVVPLRLFGRLSTTIVFKLFLHCNFHGMFSALEEKLLHATLKRHRIDLVLTFCSGTDLHSFRKERTYRIIKTFYDAIPIVFEKEYLANPLKKEAYLRYLRSFTNADAVVAISENSKRDLLKYIDYPEDRVMVVYPGVSDAFRPADQHAIADMKRRYALSGKYLLYVGGFDFRKNVPNIIGSFASLLAGSTERYQLVICGDIAPAQRDPLATLAERLGISSQVLFTGFVPNADLPILYSGAELFLFPSLYEGFGLPVIEAMACGCPVITSNNSSLQEISDAALCIDPTDSNALTQAIQRVLSDGTLARTLSQKGLARAKDFSWHAAAKHMLGIVDSVMQRT